MNTLQPGLDVREPGPIHHRQRLAGLLLGGAVGDALGLPAEGLSPTRQRRWWPGDLRHRFVAGRGMISDDTEHAFMVAQALLESGGEVERFRRALAWKLRWWFVALPAGVGSATARACLRLWLGVPPDRSGVWSAGNGPAMRSALLGAMHARDADRRRELVRVSTRLTHLDPRAETAALAVAEAAAAILRQEPAAEVVRLLPEIAPDPEWHTFCGTLRQGLDTGRSVESFAGALNPDARGVTGYAYATVTVALFAWLRHRGDFERTLTAAIRCGGDTDTVGAIAGSLAGADVGASQIPAGWREGIWDWPRGAAALERLAERLVEPEGRPIQWFWPGVIPRNLIFLVVVLAHGFRRLAPPY